MCLCVLDRILNLLKAEGTIPIYYMVSVCAAVAGLAVFPPAQAVVAEMLQQALQKLELMRSSRLVMADMCMCHARKEQHGSHNHQLRGTRR